MPKLEPLLSPLCRADEQSPHPREGQDSDPSASPSTPRASARLPSRGAEPGTPAAATSPLCSAARSTPVGGPSRASSGADHHRPTLRLAIPSSTPPTGTLAESQESPTSRRSRPPEPPDFGAGADVPLSPAPSLATITEAEEDLSTLSTLQQALVARACRSTGPAHRRLLCDQLLALFRTTYRLTQAVAPFRGDGDAGTRHGLEVRQARDAHRLVRCLNGMGELDHAQRCFKIALYRGIFPSLPSFQELADALFDAGRTAALSNILRAAIEYCPDVAPLNAVAGTYLRGMLRSRPNGGDPRDLAQIYDAVKVWSQRYHDGHLLVTFCVDLMDAIVDRRDVQTARNLHSDLVAGRLKTRLFHQTWNDLHEVAFNRLPPYPLPDKWARLPGRPPPPRATLGHTGS